MASSLEQPPLAFLLYFPVSKISTRPEGSPFFVVVEAPLSERRRLQDFLKREFAYEIELTRTHIYMYIFNYIYIYIVFSLRIPELTVFRVRDRE